jgi:riboflavin kinase/FMN adenylyltransferase
MRILDWSQCSFADRKTAVTIGVFDGVHRGHQVLIDRIVKKGPELTPMVITFRQSPKGFLKKQDWSGDILSLNRKLVIFENLGVAAVVLIDFSINFSKLTGKEFLELLRIRGNPGYAAIGSDFRCGYRMDTDAARIKALNGEAGIPTDVVEPIADGGQTLRISSSRIRAAISLGELSRAAAMLGRNVEFDFTGLESGVRSGGRFYGTAAAHRVIPAAGRYPVLLYEKGSAAGIQTEITVERDGILVPPQFEAERVEFLTGDA